MPLGRWDAETAQGPASAAYGNFVAHALAFEQGAWKMSRSEARAVNRAQLLLLEVSGAVFEDVREPRDVGIFVGVFTSLLTPGSSTLAPPRASHGVYEGTANATSIASGRISYVLGLTGPNVPVDTACSAALVAAHLAATSLRRRECREAGVVAAGALEPGLHAAFSAAGMLSEYGRCHSFDARADGYARGEGHVGFACAPRRVGAGGLAVGGSAVRQDGPSASLTAPNGASQRALLARVVDDAPGARAAALEAHGTGTALGDPVEVGAASDALAASPAVYCTSIKGNVGHLEAAAAAAGMTSLVVLPLVSAIFAPLASARRLNAHLSSFDVAAFHFSADVLRSQVDAPKRGAACGRASSFGYSGTIAHALLASAGARRSRGGGCGSLYRHKFVRVHGASIGRGRFVVPAGTTPTPCAQSAHETVVFAGTLGPIAAMLLSHHVVGGNILFPGVGYVEMAFCTISGDACPFLSAVAFLRPCVLPDPLRRGAERCALRYTQQDADAFQIASWLPSMGSEDGKFVLHVVGQLRGREGASSSLVPR